MSDLADRVAAIAAESWAMGHASQSCHSDPVEFGRKVALVAIAVKSFFAPSAGEIATFAASLSAEIERSAAEDKAAMEAIASAVSALRAGEHPSQRQASGGRL
jgi:hypothetical protein